MTLSLAHLRVAPLYVHRGNAGQEMPIMARHYGDRVVATYDPQRASAETVVWLARARLSPEGITISEVILEGHAPDLTALHHAASKLLLNVEITSGPRITEPVVKVRDEDTTQASYFIPEGWDLADTLNRLPGAFTAARPEVAHALKWIEEEKRTTGGEARRFLDAVILVILKAGDPKRVFDEMKRVLHQADAHEAAASAAARTA
ncbi:hypothetical protein ACFXPY_35860 [Streptomyces sp. NPDC059153]|uniref:hypothetical protein n=1 Tax=Streptomyces sp. NPDC059153 TaxID=3346743 RepID=UPI0036CECB92